MLNFKSFLIIASGLALAARAYQITTPSDIGTSTASWTGAGPNTVTWQRVSTDPDSFSIVLVNEVSVFLRGQARMRHIVAD